MEGQSKFNESERSKGMMRKQTKATVTQLINLNEEPGSATEPAEVLDITLAEVPSCSKETEYDILKRKYQELQNENLLKKKIARWCFGKRANTPFYKFYNSSKKRFYLNLQSFHNYNVLHISTGQKNV